MSIYDELSAWARPFNNPLECGLRSLTILVEAYPAPLDLQQLIYFDYLLVHSGDVDDGPPSLHPATPYRSGEILVRRNLVEAGLLLMVSRGLAVQRFLSSGISYEAAETAPSFLDALTTPYTGRLVRSAGWVVGRFSGMSPAELRGFVELNLDRWGAEFEHESILRHLPT